MLIRCLRGLPSIQRMVSASVPTIRRYTSTDKCRYAWEYRENGQPSQVLSWEPTSAPRRPLEPNEIRVEVKYASVNPADVNVIQGKYPDPVSKGSSQEGGRVPGSECVGVCSEIGKNVEKTRVGDVLVPCRAHLGTWQQEFICEEDAMTVLPREVRAEEDLDKYANLSVCFA